MLDTEVVITHPPHLLDTSPAKDRDSEYAQNPNIIESWKRIQEVNECITRKQLKGAFILGGGLVYESKKYEKEPVNDIDSMFIFETRKDLEEYVAGANPEELIETFGFTNGQVDQFSPKEREFFIENDIEIIRISGDRNGIKTTVKLTDAETMMKDGIGNPTRILSKKDKRIFTGKDIDGNSVATILQNIEVPLPGAGTTSVVHTDVDYFAQGNCLVPGLFTDFIVTAENVSGNPVFSKLQEFQRKKFAALLSGGSKEDKDWSGNFVRGDRFSPRYREKLNADMNMHLQSLSQDELVNATPSETGFILGVQDMLPEPEKFLPSFNYERPDRKVRCLEIADAEKIKNSVKNGIEVATREHIVDVTVSEVGSYNCNCTSGQAVTENGKLYFYKSPNKNNLGNVQAEVENLRNIRQIYRRIQNPICWSDDYGVVVFPWIDGQLQACLRLTEEGPHVEEAILNTELRRSEEQRIAYLASMDQVQTESTVGERIHLLHYDRLTGDRYKNFYGEGTISLPNGETVGFEKFSQMKINVNGVECLSFSEIFTNAAQVLQPEALDTHFKVYGLADNHAANVMMMSKDGKDFKTFDYEFAGVQPPEIDLAKTIYFDVFGRVTCYNLSPEIHNPGMRVEVDGDTINIQYDQDINKLEQELLEIKLRGILFPTLDAAREKGLPIDNWEEILRSALVTSEMLYKDVSTYQPDQMWMSIAIAAQMGSPSADSDSRFYLNKLITEYKEDVIKKEHKKEQTLFHEINLLSESGSRSLKAFTNMQTSLSELTVAHSEKQLNTERELDQWLKKVGPEQASEALARRYSSHEIKTPEALLNVVESLAFSPQFQSPKESIDFIQRVIERVQEGATPLSTQHLEDLKYLAGILDGSLHEDIEVGHVMIKPEGMDQFPSAIQSAIELELTAAGLDYKVVDKKLNEFQVRRLYPGNSTPDGYIKHLTDSTTRHIIVRGPRANEIITKMKGKWIDPSKIRSGMSEDEIKSLSGTGIRGTVKEAIKKTGENHEKWENYIHGTDSMAEGMRFLLFQ